MIDYKIIASGSGGNAITINQIVLIDCGVNFKTLSHVIADIRLVLLTHTHGDHFKIRTIKRIASEYPTMRFGCGKWMVSDLVHKCCVMPQNIDVLRPGIIYDYGLVKVSPIKLYHNVLNYGYRIYFGSEKAIYATDTRTLEGITAPNYNLYMIEANYGEEELQARISAKHAAGIYAYETNVPGRHLSKEQCDAFLYDNMGDNSTYVYLHRHWEKGDAHESGAR